MSRHTLIVINRHFMWFKLGLFIVKLISHTPFFILYCISSILSSFLIIIPGIRRIPYRNFYRVYYTKSNWELWKLTYKYICTYLDFLLEMFKMTGFSEKQMRNHCIFKNIELIERLSQKHQFILCYCGHMVNYEMFTSLPLHLKRNVGMCHLYLSAPPSKGIDWMLKIRSRYGAINIPSNNPLRTLLSLKNDMDNRNNLYKSFIFGSLADLDPKKDDKHSVQFLGHELEVKTGSEKLARKLNMGFCYAHISRPKRGYYEVEFREMHPQTAPNIYEYAYTDEFVRMLEQNIKENPVLWMQWGAPRF